MPFSDLNDRLAISEASVGRGLAYAISGYNARVRNVCSDDSTVPVSSLKSSFKRGFNTGKLLADGFEDAYSRLRASGRAGEIVLRYGETMYRGDSESQRYSY